MNVKAMSFVFGALLLAVGIIGGGFEIKEVKVPNVTTSARIFAGLFGLAFVVLGFWQPNFSTSDSPRPGPNASGSTVTMSEREHDKNRDKGDYRSFPISTDHIEDCEGACKGEAICVAWTYVKPGVLGPPAWCALKSMIPEITENVCCVSGTKIRQR